MTNAMAVREVAKQVYAKYFHDTVFCVSVSTIERRVEKLRKTFSVGRMRYGESGKEESKPVKEYKELFTKQNERLMCTQKTQK